MLGKMGSISARGKSGGYSLLFVLRSLSLVPYVGDLGLLGLAFFLGVGWRYRFRQGSVSVTMVRLLSLTLDITSPSLGSSLVWSRLRPVEPGPVP
jgi:hypothetical protein